MSDQYERVTKLAGTTLDDQVDFVRAYNVKFAGKTITKGVADELEKILNPAKPPETPVKPGKQPATPGKQPETPGKQPETPTQPATPQYVTVNVKAAYTIGGKDGDEFTAGMFTKAFKQYNQGKEGADQYNALLFAADVDALGKAAGRNGDVSIPEIQAAAKKFGYEIKRAGLSPATKIEYTQPVRVATGQVKRFRDMVKDANAYGHVQIVKYIKEHGQLTATNMGDLEKLLK
jgi:hypothetical protein